MITTWAGGAAALALAAAAGGLAGVAAAPAAAATGTERVRSDDVVLRLSADGTLAVTETVAYDFGDADDRHGLERTIPVRGAWDRDRDRTTALSGVRASSPTGAPAQVHLSTEGGVTTVRVGDPDRHVSGRQTYVLHYRLASAAGTPGRPDRLAVDVLGTGWQVPVDRVSARLTGPAAPLAARCAAGSAGSTTPCPLRTDAGGTVLAGATGLGDGRGMTVTADYPAGSLLGGPALVRTAAAGFGAGAGQLAASLGLLAAALGALVLRVRRGRVGATGSGTSGSGSEVASGVGPGVGPELAPPDGARPGQLAALLDGRARRRVLAATLVDLAARGHLLVEDSGTGPGPGGPEDWHLLPGPAAGRRQAGSPLRPYEQRTLELVAGTAHHLLSEVRTAGGVPGVLAEVSRDVVAMGWFTEDPRSVRARWYAVGGVGFVLGVVATCVLAVTTSWGLVGIAVVVTSLAVLATAWAMPVRTPAGHLATARARAFRDSLERGGLSGADAERLLPHAVALGLGSLWAARLARDRRPVPGWYHAAPGRGVPAEGYAGVFAFSDAGSSSPSTGGGTGGGGGGAGVGAGVGGGGGGGW